MNWTRGTYGEEATYIHTWFNLYITHLVAVFKFQKQKQQQQQQQQKQTTTTTNAVEPN